MNPHTTYDDWHPGELATLPEKIARVNGARTMSLIDAYEHSEDLIAATKVTPYVENTLPFVMEHCDDRHTVAVWIATMGLMVVHHVDTGAPLGSEFPVLVDELVSVTEGLMTSQYAEMETPEATKRVERALVLTMPWWDAVAAAKGDK